ncbi:MAG: aspartyl protease family protein [Candidatus Bathyarchaeia archaeon]|jgi:hypothetical protein
MYVFKYSAESCRSGIINRPKATILLWSKTHEWHPFRVYIDSGADISLFRRNDAALLGLNLSEGEYYPIIGIGRILIPTYVHTVKMKIGDTALDVKAGFADSDEVPRLLGRKDVFSHFKITFCEKELEIIFETT